MLSVTAVRPPGMYRAITRISPPRSAIAVRAHPIARARRARSGNRSPAALPNAYEMWSPTNAPTAATAISGSRSG